MTKMAAMAINKNLQNWKDYDFETCMKHQGEELYKVCINHNPWMTLTILRPCPYKVPQGMLPMHLNGEQLLKCHLKEKKKTKEMGK